MMMQITLIVMMMKIIMMMMMLRMKMTLRRRRRSIRGSVSVWVLAVGASKLTTTSYTATHIYNGYTTCNTAIQCCLSNTAHWSKVFLSLYCSAQCINEQCKEVQCCAMQCNVLLSTLHFLQSWRSEYSTMHIKQFNAVYWCRMNGTAARAPKCVARYQIRRSDPWWSLLSVLLPAFQKFTFFVWSPIPLQYQLLTCFWGFCRVKLCHFNKYMYFYIICSFGGFGQ